MSLRTGSQMNCGPFLKVREGGREIGGRGMDRGLFLSFIAHLSDGEKDIG